MFLPCIWAAFAWLLGTDTKKETIEFIAFGIGGVLATMGAIAINRRAAAQEKNAEAQMENNKLIEKGHMDERFKSATENLGREHTEARISAFYQFYYLAKDSHDNNLRNNVFDILCAHLYNMTNDECYKTQKGAEAPTEACQILLNVLFKSQESIFNNLSACLEGSHLIKANLKKANLSDAKLQRANLSHANLRRANLSHAKLWKADLSHAKLQHANLSHAKPRRANLSHADLRNTNLSEVNFSIADLSYAKLQEAQLKNAKFDTVCNIKGADFCGAKIGDKAILPENLPTDKGRYIADWTSDEFWAKVEKNEKS